MLYLFIQWVLGPSLLPRHQFGHSRAHQQKKKKKRCYLCDTFSNIVLKVCYYSYLGLNSIYSERHSPKVATRSILGAVPFHLGN